MRKDLEEIKNKRRSIKKLGAERILDDIEFGRIARQERAERFMMRKETNDEENIDI